MILTLLATLGVLGVLILVHELGHYVAARAFDIQVTRFSLGLGPKLFGFRRGETEFRISALPLGGYVKLAGMKEMELLEGGEDGGDGAAGEPDLSRTFGAKPAGVRAAVLAAGVAMNALLAVVLFAVVAVVWGRPVPPAPVVGGVVAQWLPEGAKALAEIPHGTRITRVGDRPVADMDEVARALLAARAGELTIELEGAPPVVITIPERARDRQFLPIAIEPVSHLPPVFGRVVAGGAAAEAGLEAGDRITAVDGAPVANWQDLTRVIRASPERTLELQVERDGRALTLAVTPSRHEVGDHAIGRLGVAPAPTAGGADGRQRLGPLGAMGYGLDQSRDVVALIGGFFTGLFDGRHSARELGGPVLIAQISGAATRAGLPTLLFFTALLSINLAVINLLPIPVLDGGHLFLLGVEVVRGKPPSERARLALGRVGLALVLGIMVWAVTADMLRILGI